MGLAGKKIVLGVSGGIAAYKTPELVRRLRERGAEVRVAMTEAAKAFITPLSLQAVSGFPVSDSLLDPAAEAAMGHIELGKWADLVILAPATADLIARVAAGMANDLVTTICLATPSPVAVVPAMNQQMYRNVATQHNIELLAARGLHIWGPDSGSQACGDVGPGRMLDPLEIVELAVNHFAPVNDLQHLNIMITAGPTRERLDPVRYITNDSSGKMGFAVAAAASARARASRWWRGRSPCRRLRVSSVLMSKARWRWKPLFSNARSNSIFLLAARPWRITAPKRFPAKKLKNRVTNSR